MALSGGFLVSKRPCIRTGANAHTTVLDRPVSDLDLEALNAVQATPWAINRWVLDVMLDAWARGIRIGGLEVGEPLSVPKRLADDVWATMAADDRREYLAKRARLHAENATIEGKSRAILQCLSVADELRDRPAIWYPHSKDFRQRIYPSATIGPHPQGNDIAKSLIHFATGLPLGPDGMFWLCVRAANCFGMDKLPLQERVEWTLAHTEDISQSVKEPLTSTWWIQADEPWSFLATCLELSMALSSSSSPEAFVSHLPIPLDGSCNGLQHLAAMGLDPVGSAATNLAANLPRQDVYEEVAKRVRLQAEQDVFDGIDEARVWQGKVTRKVVKRAVMTTPYGVTDRGIRDQLILDGHVPKDEDVGTGMAANYLRDRIVWALGDTVASAKSIMAWLQTTADRLAKAEVPFEWTTPVGSKVREAYHVQLIRRVHTLVGAPRLFQEQRTAGLNVRKQALGAAPNYIHSFDAAHLALTVVDCHRSGMRSFAMIHDSFGTHACNTTEMGVILRQKFVDIYRTDWLQKLKEEIAEYAPHVAIDDPPVRGDFDIEQVNDAEFFFS